MHSDQTNLLARDDTLFGVCQALGEDFRVNPFYLRVSFAVLLLWNPVAVIGAYAAAGAIVALSRLVSPNPRPAAARREAGAGDAVTMQPAPHEPLKGDNEADAEILAVAA